MEQESSSSSSSLVSPTLHTGVKCIRLFLVSVSVCPPRRYIGVLLVEYYHRIHLWSLLTLFPADVNGRTVKSVSDSAALQLWRSDSAVTSVCLTCSWGWGPAPDQHLCWKRKKTGRESVVPSTPPLPFTPPPTSLSPPLVFLDLGVITSGKSCWNKLRLYHQNQWFISL